MPHNLDAARERLSQGLPALVWQRHVADTVTPVGAALALMEEGRQLELVQMHKAESDIAVAAASILARSVFVERLAALGREFDLELPKGASSRVDAAGAEFLKKHGMNKLGQAAKLHFRTTQKIQAKPGQAE